MPQLLRTQGKDISSDTVNSVDVGGIVCTVLEENKEVLIVSLTHLRIKPAHPLNDKIMAYQKQRPENILGDNMSFSTSDVEPVGKKKLNIFNRDIMPFPFSHEKWLKDHKGRQLSEEEIDKVIEEHGGWPIK